jgi:hypothetical protein
MRPSEDVMVAELAGLVRAGMPVRRLIPALLPMREPGAPGLPKCSRLPRLRAQPHILWSRALAIVSGMPSRSYFSLANPENGPAVAFRLHDCPPR